MGAGEADAACDHYDDTQDHDRCTDCKGTGWYVTDYAGKSGGQASGASAKSDSKKESSSSKKSDD